MAVSACDADTLCLICPEDGWEGDAIAYLDEVLAPMYAATPNLVEYVVIYGHNLTKLMMRGVAEGKVCRSNMPWVDEDSFYFRSL